MKIQISSLWFRTLASAAVVLTLSSVPGAVEAGVLLEPSLGYHSSTLSMTGNPDQTYSGLGVGARAAVTFMGGFVGLDVRALTGTIAASGSSSSSDGALLGYGPVLGIDPPGIPFRFWVAYYLADNLGIKGTSSTNTLKGTALKIGAGYMLIPLLLSLNLDYEMHTYTKVENSLTNQSVDYNSKMNTIMVSLSIPLEI